MFQGEAKYQWEVGKNDAKYSKQEITRDFLAKKFDEKYITGVMRDKLAIEFQKLNKDK